MAGIFVLIFLFSLIALPITIWKPNLVSRFVNSSRKKNAIIFSGLAFLSFVLFGITSPTTPTETSDTVEEAPISVAPTIKPTDIVNPTIEITQLPTATPTPTPTVKPTVASSPTSNIYPTATSTLTQTKNPQIQTGVSYQCNCSKSCPQISSCDEAYFQLNNCGCSIRDGDNDGIPCEELCE